MPDEVKSHRSDRNGRTRLEDLRTIMIAKISFLDTGGKRVSGCFEVSGGMITVTTSDGRTRTASIKESMLEEALDEPLRPQYLKLPPFGHLALVNLRYCAECPPQAHERAQTLARCG